MGCLGCFQYGTRYAMGRMRHGYNDSRQSDERKDGAIQCNSYVLVNDGHPRRYNPLRIRHNFSINWTEWSITRQPGFYQPIYYRPHG